MADRGAGPPGQLRPFAHLEPFVRIGNDAYGLVGLILDDELSAGLKHARQRHLDSTTGRGAARDPASAAARRAGEIGGSRTITGDGDAD
jgi:hypothetical protein